MICSNQALWVSFCLSSSLSSLSLPLPPAFTKAGELSTFAVFYHYIIPHGILLSFWELGRQPRPSDLSLHWAPLLHWTDESHADQTGTKLGEIINTQSSFFYNTTHGQVVTQRLVVRFFPFCVNIGDTYLFCKGHGLHPPIPPSAHMIFHSGTMSWWRLVMQWNLLSALRQITIA